MLHVLSFSNDARLIQRTSSAHSKGTARLDGSGYFDAPVRARQPVAGKTLLCQRSSLVPTVSPAVYAILAYHEAHADAGSGNCGT